MGNTTSDNLLFALSGRAVPRGFNLLRNRFPLPVACCGDTADVQAWFYEYNGLYWYSITVDIRSTLNSIPYVSMQNCITAFRRFLRDHGLRFVDRQLAELRLSGMRRRSSPKSSEV